MKQIIFIFMAILLATGIASAQNKAVISADETSFDFGTIKEANGNVSHTFKIKNTGEAPLVLTRVIASCGCKTGDIKITYNPKDRPGPFVKTISVYSNGKTGSFILTIRGEVE